MKHHKYHILSHNTPHINADNGPNIQKRQSGFRGGPRGGGRAQLPPRGGNLVLARLSAPKIAQSQSLAISPLTKPNRQKSRQKAISGVHDGHRNRKSQKSVRFRCAKWYEFLFLVLSPLVLRSPECLLVTPSETASGGVSENGFQGAICFPVCVLQTPPPLLIALPSRPEETS